MVHDNSTGGPRLRRLIARRTGDVHLGAIAPAALGAVLVAVFALCTALPTTASAAVPTAYSIQVGGVTAFGAGSGDRGVGTSIDGRIGLELPVPLLQVVLETRLGMVSLLPDTVGGETERLFRLTGGVRVGWDGTLFVPAVFAHFGLVQGILVQAGKESGVRGTALEIGTSLDFNALPWVRFGAWTSYNRAGHEALVLDGATAVQWLGWGLAATVVW